MRPGNADHRLARGRPRLERQRPLVHRGCSRATSARPSSRPASTAELAERRAADARPVSVRPRRAHAARPAAEPGVRHDLRVRAGAADRLGRTQLNFNSSSTAASTRNRPSDASSSTSGRCGIAGCAGCTSARRASANWAPGTTGRRTTRSRIAPARPSSDRWPAARAPVGWQAAWLVRQDLRPARQHAHGPREVRLLAGTAERPPH